MAVIRRRFFECPGEHADRPSALRYRAAQPISCGLCGKEAVEVEYVRADAYQGAVEERDRLRSLLNDVSADLANEGYAKWSRDLYDQLGGQ